MRKKVIVRELCCANCAAKIEDRVSALPGVNSCAVNFMTEKMLLDVEEHAWEALMPQIAAIVAKIEPDTVVEFI